MRKNIDITTGKYIPDDDLDNYMWVDSNFDADYYIEQIKDIMAFEEEIKPAVKKINGRKNYDKVINSLYRALYTDEKLTDDELKLIIDYVMEEYK